MKTKALTYQEDNLQIITQAKYKGLIWDMGLGKTWMIAYLLENYYINLTIEEKLSSKPRLPSLIVCPSSLVYIWKEELLKHTNLYENSIGILIGNKSQRIKILEKRKYLIYIINYEGLRVLQHLLPLYEYEIICLDEAHRIKNHKALQSKMAVKLKSNRRFILTGTPILNSYLDIWNLAFFLDKGKTFGDNFYIFRNLYFQDMNIGRYRGNFPDWKIINFRKKALLKKMEGLFHRLDKKDVLKYLPQKTYITRYCYLTKINKKHYEDMKRKNITFFNDKAVVGQIALTKMLRLNQITSGFIKNVEDKEENLYHNPKLELLKEVVSEIMESNTTNKIIIWAVFRMDMQNIINAIKDMGLKYVLVMGATPAQNRVDAVNQFQTDPTMRVFVGQVATASEGITLTQANYSIYYSMDYSLKNRLQSEDRNHRKGSEIHNKVTYIDLVVRDTIDEIVLRKVETKTDRLMEAMNYLKEHNIKYSYVSGGV